MTMIQCERHGLSFITQCCVHVAPAVEQKGSIEAFVTIDGWSNPSVLCGGCHAKALEVIATHRAAHSEERFSFDYGAEDAFPLSCTECLRDWFRQTQGRGLAEAVLAAREEPLE